VLRLFQPDRDPEAIKPRRVYVRRTRYFARNELSRLILGALRDANGKLVATDEIVSQALAAKGFDAADAIMRGAVRGQALAILRAYRKRGTVEQIGLGRGVRWKLANGA
jgi:DNA polymerase III delta subunit